MSPRDVRSARETLGLSQRGLAEALRMGANGERQVRRWESGETPISGPATVALNCLLNHGEEEGSVGLEENAQRPGGGAKA